MSAAISAGIGGMLSRRGVADRLGRRDQQEQPGLRGQAVHPVQEALLDPARQRLGIQEAEPARQITRQLQQGQRGSPGLGHEPVADVLIDLDVRHRGQQGVRVFRCQACDLELRQSEQVLGPLARTEDEGDRLREEPPGDEAEDLPRGPVHPLRVVDHAEQGTLLRGVRQQAQYGQRDQEAFGRRSPSYPKDRLEGVALRCRKGSCHRPGGCPVLAGDRAQSGGPADERDPDEDRRRRTRTPGSDVSRYQDGDNREDSRSVSRPPCCVAPASRCSSWWTTKSSLNASTAALLARPEHGRAIAA
ncbi:hypothetical protein [Nonomuraea sp. NPDC048901]|uniref:hypothetical protein n=1 Tax=Nonomuraea sp. NPDC048901 TaxID=3155627 RepID=UPI0033E10355